MNYLGVGVGENYELHDPKRSSGWDGVSVSKRRRIHRSPSPTISDIISEAAGLSESEGVSSGFDGGVRDDVTTASLRPRIARIRTISIQTLRTSERIETLIETLRNSTFNGEDLSKPETMLYLPYPSTVRKPPLCFDMQDVNGIRKFRYMGREILRDLVEMPKQFLDGKSTRGTYYFFGPPGSGKSHILAALACLLLQRGETVLYIPDCAKLCDDPMQLFKEIFSFTYYERQNEIQSITNKKRLYQFALTLLDTPTVCIIDNIDALVGQTGDSESKSHVASVINVLSTNHFIIYGTSTGISEATESHTKILGGLSELEMKQWWLHFSKEMPVFEPVWEEKEEVEYETGRLPFLLRQLNRFSGKSYTSIRNEFMSCQIFMDLRGNVSKLVRRILTEADGNPEGRSTAISHLEACVQKASTECTISSEYCDRRYFYFNGDIGHCTCGIVRDAITKILLSTQPALLKSDSWLNAVNDSANNASLRGFLVEMICLSQISTRGLKNVDVGLDAMPITQFSTTPNWGQMVNAEPELEGIWRRLYVPKAYNYEAIDAFIAMLNKEERTLKLFAIQVTIANKHKDSEKQFFNKWWRQYYTSIPNKFKRHYTVSVAFVWLHRGEYVTEELKSIAEHIKVVDGPSEYKQFKIPLETIHNSFDKL